MKQKIVLVLSVVAGLVAAVLTRTYLDHKNAEVAGLKARFYAQHGGTMEVLAFARNVPAGSVIQKSDLGLLTVPKSGLRGQAITQANLSDVVGRRLLLGHREKDVLFWSDIEGGNPSSGGLAGDVKKLMRAVSINCSGASSVSGMVRPNDHVDVIGTFSFPGKAVDRDGRPQLELVTCTILQNVLVLATGKETAKSAAYGHAQPGGATYSTVTLEVTPREAEMLVFAEQIKGRLSLSLRNRNDTSYEKELPQVDFAKIRAEIEELNTKRQLRVNGK